MFIGNKTYESKLWIGTFVLPSKEDDLKWLKLTSKSHWQVAFNSINVGEIEIDIKAKDVIFDSGTSLTYIPTSEYSLTLEAITKD